MQGSIRAGNEAITYYKDPHELAGKCDFVMANPPFNVDEVDAEKVKGDKRLPFGLPGGQQVEEGLQRQLLVASVFLQLPERETAVPVSLCPRRPQAQGGTRQKCGRSWSRAVPWM